jgi:hypothetical protein
MSKTRARATKARFSRWAGASVPFPVPEEFKKKQQNLWRPESHSGTISVKLLDAARKKALKGPSIVASRVKDSSDPAIKYDTGKPPLELLSEVALLEIAKVLDYGARKYSVCGECTCCAQSVAIPAISVLDSSNAKTDGGIAHLPTCSVFQVERDGRDNWRRGMKWRRLIGAALRHLLAFSRGEDLDPETGLSHLAHLGCCTTFLLEYQLTGNGTDDRWKGES